MTIVIISSERLTPHAVMMITNVTASESKEKQVDVKYAMALR